MLRFTNHVSHIVIVEDVDGTAEKHVFHNHDLFLENSHAYQFSCVKELQKIEKKTLSKIQKMEKKINFLTKKKNEQIVKHSLEGQMEFQ